MSRAPVIRFGCAICSDVFEVNDQRHICTIQQCGHVYHECCLNRWFRTQIQDGTQSNCPKCRAQATENQIIRLFLHATTVSDNNETTELSSEEDIFEDKDNDFDDLGSILVDASADEDEIISETPPSSAQGNNEQIDDAQIDMDLEVSQAQLEALSFSRLFASTQIPTHAQINLEQAETPSNANDNNIER